MTVFVTIDYLKETYLYSNLYRINIILYCMCHVPCSYCVTFLLVCTCLNMYVCKIIGLYMIGAVVQIRFELMTLSTIFVYLALVSPPTLNL